MKIKSLKFFISLDPQGQPKIKADSNQCATSPCMNGGQCVDLYRRYACICPDGYVGSRCETGMCISSKFKTLRAFSILKVEETILSQNHLPK